MGDVPAIRVGDAALCLPHAGDVVGQPPDRPAPGDLGGVEQLERDALGREAAGVIGPRDRRIGRP
jgi:hypothetical protein